MEALRLRHCRMSTLIWAVSLVSVASINRTYTDPCSIIHSLDTHHAADKRDRCLLQTASNVKITEADDANALLATARHVQDPVRNVNQHVQDPVGSVKKTGKAIKSGAKKAAASGKEVIEGTAAEHTGVEYDSAGDLKRFLTALVSNGIVIIACVIFFLLLRHHYSDVFEYPLVENECPKVIVEEGWFDWARMSLSVNIDDVQDHTGLDMAMLLEFNNLGMRIMAIIGIPMMLIMGPMHFFFGGHAAGNDRLSYFSFGNVEFGNWLHWIHCFLVWAVVITVQDSVYRAMDMFMVQRRRWLKELPQGRANTILVQRIPEDWQSDDALKDYFERIFGEGVVKSAKCVKKCPVLTAAVEKKAKLTRKLDMATFEETELEKEGKKVEANSKATDIVEIRREIATIDKEIKREREKVVELADEVGGVNALNGFVEFHDRTHAELAATANFSTDIFMWKIQTPPPPETINWHNLKLGIGRRYSMMSLAYLLVAILYFLYVPLVVKITELAQLVDMGPLQWFWSSLAPYVGLQFVVAFLPTFIHQIIILCFPLVDSAKAQLILQNWYFLFQLVFVILVTAIGKDILKFTLAFFTRPLYVFKILGSSIPPASHFYMTYELVQCAGHFIVLTRYFTLLKYIVLRRFFEREQAKELCEPEDQDYYGIGSRSARLTIQLIIGVIFGTLCPPLCVLTFINFAAGRLIYGYLVCFAETKKPDLGGAFWVNQLLHMFWGNMIYCMMMTGVLWNGYDSRVPGYIAGSSLIYVLASYLRFKTRYKWERLPIYEAATGRGFGGEWQSFSSAGTFPAVLHGTFEQPEFVNPNRRRKGHHK